MTSLDPVADSLLVHATFVRRLARALAGADGDDLAQDTWTAALQAPRGEVHNPRGWLASIARNLAKNVARGDARRRRREARVAVGSGAVPSVGDIVAREEARRRVVDAVVALPEPLRSVVLLHFFEGLDSRAIGERLGTPASTVRTQLQRALASLRQRLDREHGDRRAAWTLPLLACGKPSPAHTLGILLRTSWPLRAAIGIAALALVGWLVVPLFTPPPAPPALPPVEVASTEPRREESPLPPPAAAAQRDAVAPVAAPTRERGPEDLWGHVVDAVTAAPIAGAEVVLEHRDADEMTSLDLEHGKLVEEIGRTQTGADGGFAFRVTRALQHRIAVRAAGYAPLREAMCTGGSEFVLRLERPAAVEGVVRAENGAPLADVPVEAFERGGTGERAITRTAPDGTFTLGDLPPRVSYVVAHPAGRTGSEWQEVALEPGGSIHVEITIAAGRTVHGTVRDAESGFAIPGARVSANWTMDPGVATAADGSYEFAGIEPSATLYVRADGYADQVQPVAGRDEHPTVDFALVRGDAIVGRVIDEHGHGIPKAFVAAAADQWSGSGGVDTFWRSATLGDQGSFRIDRLGRAASSQPRAWQLLVRAPGMGARVLALPYRRLTDGVLDVGDIRLLPQAILEGRIVDGDGRPVAGARVTLQGTPNDVLALAPDTKNFNPVYHFWARATRTADNGTYRIAGLAAGSYVVHAEPPGVTWDLHSDPYEVAAGAIVTVPDLVADSGLTIAGRVRLTGGRDLPAGTQLTIHAFGPGSDTRSDTVAADGTFRIERVERGEFTLAALAAPPGLALVPRSGIAAGSKDVELELAVATTIEGTVVDDEEKPVRGATVYFFPQGVDTSRNSRSDADGRFRIELAPGVVGSLGATHPDQEFCQANKPDVVAGTVGITLQLKLPEALRRK
ncbi:MAG: sigma-70 family RNA polymerase sigma factor [Planctomycetota bacterium]